MDREDKSWRKRFNPMRLADAANDEFVRMAQMLGRLLTWDVRLAPEPDPASAAGESPNERTRPESYPTDIPPLDPQTWSALAQRIDRIVSRTGASGAAVAGEAPAGDDPDADGQTLRAELRDVFHHDAARRLQSVRWIARERITDAVPLLRAVLAVEEDEEVKNEVAAALHALRSAEASGVAYRE